MSDRFKGWRTPTPSKKRGKYGNRKTVTDGIQFDSALEARHYQKLQLMKAAGEVQSIETQVRYPIKVNGDLVTTYVADFVVTYPDGAIEVQDTKGFKTPEYRLKKKLMKAVYCLDIVEVSR